MQMQHTDPKMTTTNTALFENGMSPEIPDRKRYAIKEKVSLGVYKPSFSMQPDSSHDIAAFMSRRNDKNSMHMSDEGILVNDQVSPKIENIPRREQNRLTTEEDFPNVDAKASLVSESQAVRKVSLPASGLSFKTSQVMKKRVRGDIRTMIA